MSHFFFEKKTFWFLLFGGRKEGRREGGKGVQKEGREGFFLGFLSTKKKNVR